MISKTTAIAGAVFATFAATAVSATTLSITVTNNQGPNGLAIAPFYTAFHNDSFDAFSVGETASGGLEQLAEVGSPALIASDRAAAFPDSQGGVAIAEGATGPGPLLPGQTSTLTITIDDTVENQYFTFLAMILPSNDAFVGNDNALQLFDATGAFLGPQTFNVTSDDAYDAGTELTDVTAAPGVAGGVATNGTDENGVITAGVDLSAFAGLGGLTGGLPASLAGSNAFFGGSGTANLLTVSISEVAPVPLPASSLMLLSGLGFAGFAMRRRQKKNKSA